jgi:predicted SAM-dependent methyltransferase
MSNLFRRTAGPPLRYAQRVVGAMVRPVQLQRHASRNKEFNVCIGCGWDVREGWLNTDYGPNRLDVVFLDACQLMPFADSTVDRYYAEHMIEHVPIPEAEKMLRECLRTLKPGGRIRLVTPDLKQLMRLLTEPDDPVVQQYSAGVSKVCNQPRFQTAVTNTVRTFNIAVRDWGHEFMYDFPSLKALLEAVGFSDVQRFKVQESDDPGLKGIERHQQSVGDFINNFESMAVEAAKPP